MLKTRLIARLDIKNPNLVKPVHLEGVRVIGNPQEFATRYSDEGIDEILFMDVVASLYGRNSLERLVEDTTKNVFCPVTVGGGIRTVGDVNRMLRAGADKVAINTAAIKRPELIEEVAKACGSQCMVLSIEARRKDSGWICFTDNGREHTGKDVIEWAKEGESRGAGEILLTSVDREGTGKGFDIELIQAVTDTVKIPVIASGGMGSVQHLVDAVKHGANAVAMADVLHYDKLSLQDIKQQAYDNGVLVRMAA